MLPDQFDRGHASRAGNGDWGGGRVGEREGGRGGVTVKGFSNGTGRGDKHQCSCRS